MVYRSGLDWSGDAGDPTKQGASPTIVFAIAHIDESRLEQIELNLRTVRQSRGLPPTYAFKYHRLQGRPELRAAFFAGIGDLSISATVLVVDKSAWPENFRRTTRGPDRITKYIADLIRGCADGFVVGHTLLIDGEKDETPTLTAARNAVSRAMEATGRRSFRKVKMSTDDSAGGEIIQVADMIAGAIRRHGVDAAELRSLRRRITII
jgi:hypothetical protein